ncbi:uncharacterized protein FOBCDRAFT_252746 [Fusarium oxysporum Fo47]|uniref:uncharacterized protein n=1 Tax=Fusarium oxysporum Fo47 TaxID=660027 RepID=UPI002869C543|nr:uncharacterized protein FOBCDRAFT_252746 [Fusarium oxysporum Fo47]QKD59302.2 hypothetical protein FOBCDRAFT_252746 [Fusarium oxysporum Fo47]
MPKAYAASAWPGAPPVSEDGFAFAEGVFFAQSSGQNRHRRATATELKEHFTSGNDKYHPAHWFEAKLIHYGLPPSKTKSVARMRLFDAANAGNLKVPATVSKLETKLKKEWTKNDREAKKGAASKPAAQVTPVKTETKKTSAPARQRQRQRTLKRAPHRHWHESPRLRAVLEAVHLKPLAEEQAPLQQNRQNSHELIKLPAEETHPDGQQVVRADRQQETLLPKHPDSQRLRLLDAAALLRPGDEYPLHQDYSSDENNSSDDVDEVSLAPLGLLNGDYEVESLDVSEQWDFDPDEFQLTLTISGNRLWGRFNLGVYEGVLLFEERPMRSSHDRVWFKWRGREDQGPVIYGDNNEGWMEFLGNGRIEARRLPGQGTRSSIDARTLQDEWNGYSYDLYEEENRARWR